MSSIYSYDNMLFTSDEDLKKYLEYQKNFERETKKQSSGLYGTNPEYVIVDEYNSLKGAYNYKAFTAPIPRRVQAVMKYYERNLPDTEPIENYTIEVYTAPTYEQSIALLAFVNSLTSNQVRELGILCQAIMREVVVAQECNFSDIELLKLAHHCTEICTDVKDQVDMFFEISECQRKSKS